MYSLLGLVVKQTKFRRTIKILWYPIKLLKRIIKVDLFPDQWLNLIGYQIVPMFLCVAAPSVSWTMTIVSFFCLILFYCRVPQSNKVAAQTSFFRGLFLRTLVAWLLCVFTPQLWSAKKKKDKHTWKWILINNARKERKGETHQPHTVWTTVSYQRSYI